MNVGGNFIMEKYCLDIPGGREVNNYQLYKMQLYFSTVQCPLPAAVNIIVV